MMLMMPTKRPARSARRARPARRARRACARVLSLLLTLLLVLALSGQAEARRERLRLERIDATHCAEQGTIRAFVTELELEGIVRPLTPKALHLVVNGEAGADTPKSAVPFSSTRVPLRVALVIQTSLGYQADIPRISAAAIGLVRKLPSQTVISLIVYGWQARVILPAGSLAQAERLLENLTANHDAGMMALIPALERGLELLTAPPPARAADGGASKTSSGSSTGSGTSSGKSTASGSGTASGDGAGADDGVARRLLVVISDGLNRDLGRIVFRGFADKAKAAGVPIHPIAYSPNDERQPLLNLGELAKRSYGTLRWAKKPADLREQFANLAREINKQLVLTFKMPDSCKAGHSVQISHGVLRSNTLTVAKQTPKASPSSRPWLTVVLVGGGLLLSALMLLLARGLRRSTPD